MKLRYSPTSPYTRKVTVTALETGLHDKIERVPTNVDDPNNDIWTQNPLVKVPCLVTDDGTPLFDSPVICEYLDSLSKGPKMFPAPGPARWTALRRQALADGIMDAAILRMGESRREKNLQSEAFLKKQSRKMEQGLDALEAEADKLNGPLDIGLISIGCVLEYLDLRWPGDEWWKKRPKLTAWQKTFGQRPSMLTTVPPKPTT